MSLVKELRARRNILLREIRGYARIYQFLNEEQVKKLEEKWQESEKIKKAIEVLK